MQTYLPNTNLTLTIPLLDDSGNSLSPSTVEWELSKSDGTVLVSRAALSGFSSGESEAIVTVLAANNALASGTSEGRVITLFAQVEQGWVSITEVYQIALPDTLEIPTTSFQTYADALMTAKETPNLPSFNGASKSEQVAALAEAKLKIARMRFRYRYWDSMWQSRVEPTLTVADLDLITLSEFNSLPQDFKIALKKAQVIEADHILGGDEISNRRDQGVMSETIGESSMMFRPGRAPRYPICTRAMSTLSKYLQSGRLLGRA